MPGSPKTRILKVYLSRKALQLKVTLLPVKVKTHTYKMAKRMKMEHKGPVFPPCKKLKFSHSVDAYPSIAKPLFSTISSKPRFEKTLINSINSYRSLSSTCFHERTTG